MRRATKKETFALFLKRLAGDKSANTVKTMKDTQGGNKEAPVKLTAITALGRCEWDWLTEAGESLTPLSVENKVEWVISIDGGVTTPGQVAEALRGKEVPPYTILAGNGKWQGPGPTRTAALKLAHSEWVITLDSDDRVEAGGVGALLKAAEEAEAGWGVGLTYDMNKNGELTWEGPEAGTLLPLGAVPKGAVMKYVEKTGTLPLHCSSVIIRTEIAQKIGGWPALRRGEDIALIAVASSLYGGIFIPEYVHHYRRHEKSITQQKEWETLKPPWELIKEMTETGSTQIKTPAKNPPSF